MPKVKRDMDTLRRLKQEGHDTIDRLKGLGITQSTAYFMMADRLGCSEEFAHFYKRYTVREVQQAVDAVLAIEQERIALLKRKKEETMYERRAAREAEQRKVREKEIALAVGPRHVPKHSEWWRLDSILAFLGL